MVYKIDNKNLNKQLNENKTTINENKYNYPGVYKVKCGKEDCEKFYTGISNRTIKKKDTKNICKLINIQNKSQIMQNI